ncbi:MAG TPA: ectoine synthase [Paracoccaceae bacterium]|nr:ectoine synthase [Paracoccaceae bacterium]
MIVRTLEEITGTAMDVSGPGWQSRRLLTRPDGMEYTMTDTIIRAGAEMVLEYANHLEACYCISGEGDVRCEATGVVHPIRPGTLYALDQHDRHTLRCAPQGDMRLICCFTPALTGTERHGASGGYES